MTSLITRPNNIVPAPMRFTGLGLDAVKVFRRYLWARSAETGTFPCFADVLDWLDAEIAAHAGEPETGTYIAVSGDGASRGTVVVVGQPHAAEPEPPLTASSPVHCGNCGDDLQPVDVMCSECALLYKAGDLEALNERQALIDVDLPPIVPGRVEAARFKAPGFVAAGRWTVDAPPGTRATIDGIPMVEDAVVIGGARTPERARRQAEGRAARKGGKG